MSENVISKDIPILRYEGGQVESLVDQIICESEIHLFLNGKPFRILSVLDRDVDDLIWGLLYAEGFLRRGDIPHIHRTGSRFYIETEQTIQVLPPIEGSDFFKTDPVNLLNLMKQFVSLPSVYHNTGGVHMAAAALRGDLCFWADDISRRFAVDKVFGKALREGTDLTMGILLVSCRLSSDIIDKIAYMNIPCVVSLSAPTDKAREKADKCGITLCGFARGERFNIYSHPEQISMII